MKKYLLSLITLTLLLCEAPFLGGGMAFAADFGTNLTYTISSNTLTISVKSGYTTGTMPYWTSSNYTNATTGRPWESSKTTITTVIINKGVKNIGSYAFYGCTALATVKFGTSTTDTCSIDTIGTAAFTSCNKVATVYCYGSTSTLAMRNWLNIGMYGTTSNPFAASTVKGSSKRFYMNSSSTTTLTTTNLSKATKIKPYAFYKHSQLTSVTLPSTVKSIGNFAFANDSSLATVKFGSGSSDQCGLDTIMSSAFSTCVALSTVYCYGGIEKWLHIGFNAGAANPLSAYTGSGTKKFYLDGTSITTLTIPEGITKIKGYAFYKHTQFTKISLPSTVSYVGAYALAYCTGLTDLVALPTTPPNTESSTFNNITPANINLYVASAASAAYGSATRWSAFTKKYTTFEGECGESGDNITFVLNFADHSLTLTGSGAMATYSTSTKAPWYTFKDDIHTISIGSGITGIGACAFKDCANVTSASIPASITSIGSSAFDGCKAMTSYSYAGTIAQWLGITFGGSSSNPMCNVKKCYANGSTEVNNLVIPDGITTIGNYAFYQCSGLTSVTLPASLTTVNNNAFATCTNIANTNFLGTIDQWCSISFNSTACNPAFFSKQLSINGIEQTDIYLSDELTEIKNYTFYDNAALTSISVKNTTTIRPNALTNCAADIVVRGELSADFGTGLHWSLLDGVLTISGEGAMPITYATGGAPWYPYRNSINKIIVEEGITRIGKYCFEKITNTCGVFLPESLTNIDNYAFYGSTGIAYIVSKNTTPPAIPAVQYGGQYSYASHTFYNVPTTSAIYVPSGSESDYASAVTTGYNTSDGWKRFSTFYPFTGTCGDTGNEANVTWVFDPSTSTLTISGSGAMYSSWVNASSTPWAAYKTNIQSVVIESGVTSIGRYAFNGCSNLASITIPASVTTFNTLSFSGCSNLATVNYLGTANQWASSTFASTTGDPAYYSHSLYLNGSLMTECTISVPVSNNAFNYNTSLTSVTLANGCTSVGENAFSSCSNLSSLTISPDVTTFGSNAFSSCSKLDKAQEGSVNYLGSANQWASINFSGSSSNPAYYSKSLKLNGTTLTNCTISVDIKPYTFYRNEDLVSLTLGANTEVIGTYAFNSCKSLETVICSASTPLDSIASSAFYDCKALSNITLPNTLRKVMGSAFYGNNALSSVDFLGTADQWASIYFNGTSSNPASFAQSLKLNDVTLTACTLSVPVGEYAFYNNKSLTSLTLNSGCTSIGSSAFYQCSNIAGTLTIPSTTTAINSSAFRECTSLTGLDLSNATSLQTIGSSAFWQDAAIAGELYIPASVTTVGTGAFNTMSGITTIYAMPTTVPTGANQYTFGGFDTSIPFYVTSSTAASNYAAAQYWQDFTNVNYLGYCGAEEGGLNLIWTFVSSTGTLTISGTGAMADYASSTDAPWNGLKTTISSLVVEDGVTTIGKFAFYGCTAITSLNNLPNSLTSIGYQAFYGCTGLTSFTLPEYVTAVGYDMVRDCAALASVTWNARNCTQYINSTGTKSNISSTNNPFYGSTRPAVTSFTFGNNVQAIANGLCYSMSNLTSVTIPSSVATIGNNAFQSTGLTSITIPNSVISIGSAAFKGCTSLATVTFEDTPQLTAIQDNTFENCSTLNNFTIPVSVTTIGKSAFKSCAALTSITIPENVTTITCFSSGTTYIPFSGCSSLTSVTWNARNCTDGFAKIGSSSGYNYASPFSGLGSQITSFTFGPNVQAIPNYLCRGMNNASFTSVTIPSTVTSIGAETFAGCSNIELVSCNATTPPTVQSTTFSDITSSAALVVPGASKANYVAANYWKDFYRILPYVVQYDLNGHGSAEIADEYVGYGGRIEYAPADPTADYYTFGGWYSNEGCTTPFTFGESGTVVNGDLTLYAKWTINQYTISFDSDGGSAVASITQDYNSAVAAPADPTRTGYTFDGWSPAVPNVMPGENTECVAQWTINQYTVSFDSNGGSEVSSITQDYNSAVTAPADPTKTGYTFAGWTPAVPSTMPAENTECVAQWTINSYDVTFDLQDHGSAIDAQSVNYNGLVDQPSAPSADYYTFGGWYKEAGCSNAWDFSEDRISEATTLYAKWTRADLTLNDNADNSDALTEYNTETTTVHLTRTIISASFNTICLPFAMNADQVESAFGGNCDIEELTRASYADGNLKLFFTKRTAIEAGKPYLIQPQANVTNPVIADVTIDKTARPSIFDGVTFHGTFSPTDLANSESLFFLGASNTLYMSSGGQMNGLRGYFQLTTPAASAAAKRSARIVFHEEVATGIETVESQKSKVESTKIMRDGQLYILRDGKTYNAQGALVK